MPLFNVPKYSFNLPFFMFDLTNFQLITSKIIPGDISDTKSVILTEQAIPGLGYNPVSQGGMGNRHISFEIPLIKRNNTIGNVLILKQWETLRNKGFGIQNIFKLQGQFTPNPKVLFNWGIGSVPLVWYVKDIGITHRSDMVNELGNPTMSSIKVELILDEEDIVNVAETVFRKISAYSGTILQAFDFLSSDAREY